MRVRNIVLLVIGLGLLATIVAGSWIFVLPQLRPTALQQLLQVAHTSPDLMPTVERADTGQTHDFTVVEQALLAQVTRGSPEAAVQSFLEKRGVNCRPYGGDLVCQLYNERFPCRTTIMLIWQFDSARHLRDISISEGQACL